MNLCVLLAIFVASTTLLADSQVVAEQPPLCNPAQDHSSAIITNDTKGVDFKSYLIPVVRSVKASWYSLVPESAILKKRCVAIQFKILPDGRVTEMEYASTSGDIGLDHAAWGGIMAAEPFPPLPAEFKGNHLTLRFAFFYNLSPDAAGDMKPAASGPGTDGQTRIGDDSALTADSHFIGAHSPNILPPVPILVPDTSPINPGRLAFKTEAKYPKEARKAKVQGAVELEVTVEKNGAVDEISILSGDLTLADAAVDAVRAWTFEPYMQSGKPVQARQKLVFRFNLDGKIGELDENFPQPTLASEELIKAENSSSEGPVYRVGQGVTAPRAIQMSEPEYSEAARKVRYQGTCVLSLVVNAEGQPEDIKIERAIGLGLDAKAVDAVKRWRFQPAMKNGVPVAASIRVEVNFHLY
jgi:TonB family protein